MPAEKNASKRLKHSREKIIVEWEKRVRRDVMPTRQLDPTELRNSLPEVLDVMVDTLSDPNPEEALHAKEMRLAVSHGKTRAQDTNYSLDQVIDEYHVLSQVLFEILEENNQELTRTERDLILDIISISIRNAATKFKEIQDQQKADIQEKLNQVNADLEGALGGQSAEAILRGQLLKTIFERVEDYAMFSLDPEGKVTSWSDGCQKMKQYAPGEIMGRHFSILYPPEGRIRNEPQIHLDIATVEGRFRGEGLRMRKNGDLFLADVLITPMYEGDELVGYFKTVADLTERNQLIQEIDLTRTQVEVLELENELRDRFIYMLTHDLRNPLSAALLSSEVIARQSCNVKKHRELAQRSIRHIRRIDEMVTNLLDASRITEGEPFPLKINEFDLTKLINEVCEDLATIMGDRFTIKVPAEVIGFWDQDGLKRVIENLVTNAIKYGNPQGDVTISLVDTENRVIVKVHNLGSTITGKDKESFFELFHRADTVGSGANKGWGLGLTLVRGVTEAHGGRVTVRSLPKEGTTFTVDLPRDARLKAT